MRKPGSFPPILLWLFMILLYAGCKVHHLAYQESKTYSVEYEVAAAEIEQMIVPYRQQLQDEMDELVGYASKELKKKDGESTLGNWVADAVLQFAERLSGEDLDLGICNSGGLRLPSLPQGKITKRHMFELMPFDNYLVIMEMDSALINRLFQHMATREGWPISAGLSYTIKNQKAVDILINGRPLSGEDSYQVVLSDYLAEGGDACFFLQDRPVENLGVFYRDAMIGQALWLTARGEEIDSRIEGRIKMEDR